MLAKILSLYVKSQAFCEKLKLKIGKNIKKTLDAYLLDIIEGVPKEQKMQHSICLGK